MTGYDLTEPGEREDRRKHLELVASVVGRMASSSAQAKGWSITLAGAAFGVAVIRDNAVVILLGIVGLCAFAVIDAHYLNVERTFRDLHDAIVANTVEPLSMETKGLSKASKNESYASWSIKYFYGPLIVPGSLLFVYSLCHEKENDAPRERPVKVTVTVTPAEHPSPAPTTPETSAVPSPSTAQPVPPPTTTTALPEQGPTR
ncbi:hypothetical protein MMAD_38550 [Mycolicibacterium madagascariense]|uniref:Uncharacterized protein n=1 Tax=Mycolicibacterium madagascariense TaxID=212765 RepID=A0A7I7XK31_9MYCO|nr:hypothetical protein [Mycolicibacterium madagascariense]MCV7011207.1 hypothetical protein [Mycolicibacterium madagascariense]BBZ29560.1 hypothetical protein MMAD_38550 [Mycolicibacterium madagascariense]